MKSMEVGTLVLSSAVWGAIAAVLVMNLLLKRHRTRLLFISLLMAATGSVIDSVARVLRVSHLPRLVADGAAAVLGAAGLLILLVALARQSAQRSTPPAPGSRMITDDPQSL